jgi:hypothetical protein
MPPVSDAAVPERIVVTVRALDGADATTWLQDCWPELYKQDQDATPYQSAGWLAAWAEHLPPTAAVTLLIAEDPADVLAALALVRDQDADGTTHVKALSSPVAEYIRAVGPHSFRQDVAEALVRGLRDLAQDGQPLVISDVPADTPLGRAIAAQPDWAQVAAGCAQIPLPVPWAEMSRTTRRQHRRRQRVWDELATEGHKIVYSRTRTAIELAEAVAVLRRLDTARRAGQARQFDATAEEATWSAVLRCGPDTAFVATLSLDGTPVAAQLCLYRDRRCYSLRPAMSPDHLELACGHALLRYLTDDLTRDGFTLLDLGRTINSAGQVGYKSQYLATWTETLAATAARRPAMAATLSE